MRRRTMVILAATAISVIAAQPVSATFPGSNGRLAVVRIVGDTGSVLTTMNPDGSDPRRVFTLEGFRDFIMGSDWNADATRLVLNPCCSHRLLHTIVSIAADGSDPVAVARRGDTPAWSPDGTQITYARFGRRDGGRGFTSLIYIADADGSNATRFTGLRSQAAFYPAWSPDGASIAFSRRAGEIVIKPVAGGAPTVVELPPSLEYAEQLEWAPDGNTVSLVGYTCFGDCADIFTLDVGSETFTRVTRTRDAVETDADWSPDGSTIVYVRFTDPGFEDSDLWFMDPDGSNKRALETKRLEFFVDWGTS